MKKLLIALSVLACVIVMPVTNAQAGHPGQLRVRTYCTVCGNAAYSQYNPHCGWVALPHYCPPGTCAPHYGVHYKCGHNTYNHRHSHHNHRHSNKHRHRH